MEPFSLLETDGGFTNDLSGSSFHLVVILLQQKLQCAGNYNMPTFTCAHEVVIHSPCDHGVTCMVLTNVFYRPKQLVKLNYPHQMSCCPYISSVLVCLLFKRGTAVLQEILCD